MRDQQYQCIARRFFKCLKKCIGCVAVHFLDTVDDGDTPTALGRRGGEKPGESPRIEDGNLTPHTPGLFVGGPLHGHQIGVAAPGDAAKDGVIGVHAEVGPPPAFLGGGTGTNQKIAREAERERRLADSPWPSDQPRVAEAPAMIGTPKRLFRGTVADEIGFRARRRPLRICGIDGAGAVAHGSDFEAFAHRATDRVMHRGDVRARVNECAPPWLVRGDLLETGPEAFVKGHVHSLVTIGGTPLPFSAQGDSRLTCGSREIEDQGEVGNELAGGKPLERRERFVGNALATTLVGDGRIGEAVADDPAAPSERGSDGPDNVLVARRIVQYGLRERLPAPNFAIEKQSSNGLRTGRATGLTGGKCLEAPFFERGAKEAGLGGFSGTFAAFEGDEPAAVQICITHARRGPAGLFGDRERALGGAPKQVIERRAEPAKGAQPGHIFTRQEGHLDGCAIGRLDD